MRDADAIVADFNEKNEVGQAVLCWPGQRQGPGLRSRTTAAAGTGPLSQRAGVRVEGEGFIALTHVEAYHWDPILAGA